MTGEQEELIKVLKNRVHILIAKHSALKKDYSRLILENKNTMEIQEAAQKNGMITLEQAGIIKALQGETSLEEVYRVARKSS